MAYSSIKAEIKNINYAYTLCSPLNVYNLKEVKEGEAFKDASFKLKIDDKMIGVSRWVSPKRTRSYPFARIYDTADLEKKVTVIPIVKDEGKEGDRDYIQWDTVSLMSLLNIYVIIGWYDKAKKSANYKHKITSQEFNYDYIAKKLDGLLKFQSDALHWNVAQVSDLKEVANKAREFYYQKISESPGLEMHSFESYDRKIDKIVKDAESFKESSRASAKMAQYCESLTSQPKERVIFDKCKITIKNWIGGVYYWTVDELVCIDRNAFLIEKKHSRGVLPSLNDIKDGFLKLVLYSNIEQLEIDGKKFSAVPILGLTGKKFKNMLTSESDINDIDQERYNLNNKNLEKLKKIFFEAKTNNIHVFVANSDELDKNQQLSTLKKFG